MLAYLSDDATIQATDPKAIKGGQERAKMGMIFVIMRAGRATITFHLLMGSGYLMMARLHHSDSKRNTRLSKDRSFFIYQATVVVVWFGEFVTAAHGYRSHQSIRLCEAPS